MTLPTVFFVFKETNQKSLEEIDLLFGERALGSLPAQLDLKEAPEIYHKEHSEKAREA